MNGQIVMFALLAAFAGMLIPVMATLNGVLGKSLGAPLYAGMISVTVSFLAMSAVMLALRPAWPGWAAFAGAPKWVYAGGLAMAVYATTVSFVTPKLGVGNVVVAVVVAQLVVAALIDQFGLFGAPLHPLDLRRYLGLALLGAGVVLVAVK